MVVENSEVGHLKKAMWLFPLYLLLINLFVPAIAWGGCSSIPRPQGLLHNNHTL